MAELDRFDGVPGELVEHPKEARSTTFYPCRKATDDGEIPKGELMIFEGRILPGWELVSKDDPWLRRMFG